MSEFELPSSETQQYLAFVIDQEIQNFQDLKNYIWDRVVDRQFSFEELTQDRVVNFGQDDDLDNFPEENEFTIAEAKYLCKVIDFALVQGSDQSLVDIDIEGFESWVQINFPPHLEPPVELR